MWKVFKSFWNFLWGFRKKKPNSSFVPKTSTSEKTPQDMKVQASNANSASASHVLESSLEASTTATIPQESSDLIPIQQKLVEKRQPLFDQEQRKIPFNKVMMLYFKEKYHLDDDFVEAFKKHLNALIDGNQQDRSAFLSFMKNNRKQEKDGKVIYKLSDFELGFLNEFHFLLQAKSLTPEEINNLVQPHEGSVKHGISVPPIQRNGKPIAQVIKLPEVFFDPTIIEQCIEKEIPINLRNFLQVASTTDLQNQEIEKKDNSSEVEITNQLIKNNLLKLKKYLSEEENLVFLRFDLQGRILIEQEGIFWSYDVSKNPFLKEKFRQWLSKSIEVKDTEKRSLIQKAVRLIFGNKEQSSILPIAEEMEHHLRLCIRVLHIQYQLISKQETADLDINWQEITDKTLYQLNQEIQVIYQECLLKKSIFDEKTVNIEALNKELDSRRPFLAEKSKTILAQVLKKHISAKKIKLYLLDEVVKKIFLKIEEIKKEKEDILYFNLEKILTEIINSTVDNEYWYQHCMEEYIPQVRQKYKDFLEKEMKEILAPSLFKKEISSKKTRNTSSLMLDVNLYSKLDAEKIQKMKEKVLEKFELLKSSLSLIENNLELAINNLHTKNFISTTATGLEYVRTDDANQTVVHISATDETSHHKDLYSEDNAYVGLRIIKTSINSDDAIKIAENGSQVKARVCSLAVLDKSEESTIQDVRKKLNYCYNRLAQANSGKIYNGSMVYHSLEFLSNKTNNDTQNSLAKCTLIGMHAFNAQSRQKDKYQAFWFLQNIPVNPHGKSLGYAKNNSVKFEMTLMAEMALIHTLYQNRQAFLPAIRMKIDDTYCSIIRNYKYFLSIYAISPKFFKDSYEGQTAIKSIQNFKAELASLNSSADSSSAAVISELQPVSKIHELATKALLRLFLQEAHFHLQYGMLIQTLSIFIENKSMLGGDEGNILFQSVFGRVELLQSMAFRVNNLKILEKTFLEILEQYGNGDDAKSPSDLQKALDCAYNAYCLYGASAAISYEDQGGGAEIYVVQEKESVSLIKNSEGKIKRGNLYATETPDLTYLHQNHTPALQSSKGNLARKLWEAFLNCGLVKFVSNLSFFIISFRQQESKTPLVYTRQLH